jgi:hypothetical protein
MRPLNSFEFCARSTSRQISWSFLPVGQLNRVIESGNTGQLSFRMFGKEMQINLVANDNSPASSPGDAGQVFGVARTDVNPMLAARADWAEFTRGR